eukprot:TRINITY_DN9567_c0_g1_i1.p1 TRINITY_DN9567_c0_g1~~TRINITY_DN9567_c0_g1_i1.p1  ORF type:complete len:524 (+),score=93.20 TRINITY_DN9567_c0_g1_i1:356-1927(+)
MPKYNCTFDEHIKRIIAAEEKFKSITYDLEDTESVICYGEDKSIRKSTLYKLVEKATSSLASFDIWIVNELLLSYHDFASPVELMVLLYKRFVSASKILVKMRVFNMLRRWSKLITWDWENNIELAMIYSVIYHSLEPDEMFHAPTVLNNVKYILNGCVDILAPCVYWGDTEEPHIPELPPKSKIENLINEVSALELARQLTQIESVLWRNIKPWDCISKNNFSGNSVVLFKNHFNRISHWVATEICKVFDKKERASVVDKFIDIAMYCNQFHNYNGVMEILGGLTNPAVFRMKSTFKYVRNKLELESLKEVVSEVDGFSNMRKILKEIIGIEACIPYLGIYLSDLVRVDAGGLKIIDGLINFTKYRRISSLIEEIIEFGSVPYKFLFVVNIRDKILSPFLQIWSDDTLFNTSVFIEPKHGKSRGDPPKEIDYHYPNVMIPYPSYLLSKSPNPLEYAERDGTSYYSSSGKRSVTFEIPIRSSRKLKKLLSNRKPSKRRKKKPKKKSRSRSAKLMNDRRKSAQL